MKKLINLFFLLLTLTTISLISCTKESDLGEAGRHRSSSIDSLKSGDILRGEELYEKISFEIDEYLHSQDNPSIENVQLWLTKHSPYVTSEVRDNILYILVDSTYEYICDIYGVTCQDEIGNYDDEDVDVISILEEINSALYPEEEVSNTRTNQVCSDDNSFTMTRAFWNDKIVINPVCLIWDPWKNGNNIVLKNTSYSDEGMEAVHTFKANNYNKEVFGLVNIRCHGTPEGYMLIPRDAVFGNQLKALGMILGKEDKDYGYGSIPEPVYDASGKVIYENGKPKKIYKPAYSIFSSGMMKLFPDDISSTIVWMNMCFSDSRKSALRKVLEEKKVAAFAGASVRSSGSVTDPLLRNFNKLLFNDDNPMSAANAAKESFGKRAWLSSYSYYRPYNYENVFGEEIRGDFSIHYYGHDISTKPGHKAKSAIDGEPRGEFTVPGEWYESVNNTRGSNVTKASSGANLPFGFWIRNQKTKEVLEIPISKSTVKEYENEYTPSFFPKNSNEPKMIARIEYLGNTDDLDEGTYEYKTFLEIDGKKEYSDETYEFEVKRINKVVPEWLLEMMEPYIPIYEGDNPPMVEGTYLLSPQKLFYDSSKQYSSGKIFADNYLFFTDQDEVEDTINFVGFEVNNNGDIISEKYGEGAFISGEGNDFSIFFNTAGEHYFNDGYSYSNEALIVSGTKTSTGIRDIYYAFAMVDKYDPYNHLMPIGAFRVFKDGDGMTEYIDLTNSGRTRTRSNDNNKKPLLSSDAYNDHCFTYQRSVPFYEWKNKMDKLKRIRIVNGKKVKK